MTYREPARTTTYRIRRTRFGGRLFAVAALAAVLGYQVLASSHSSARSPLNVLRSEHRGVVGDAVWPREGQSAFIKTGESRVQAGPNQHSAAIASVAKV